MPNRPILLVEDDDNDVFFFQRAAAQADIRNPLHIVRDGQAAIDFLSSAHDTARSDPGAPLPGLLLLDLNLPHMHGLDVLRWIQQQPALKTLITVVITSSNSELDIDEAYELGANSYLVKPGNPDELIDLTKLLKTYWLLKNRAPLRFRG